MLAGLSDGGMLLEGKYFVLSQEALLGAFFIQSCFAIFLWLSYRFFLRVSIADLQLGSGYAWFLFLLQFVFLVYNQVAGVNVAGVESHGSGLSYIFILLQPDVLFLLIGLGLKSRPMFLLNSLLFLVSMFLRGWMGGVFLVVILFLCRLYPIRMSPRSLIRSILFLLMFLVFLPIVIEAKWAMRTGVSVADFVSGVMSVDVDSYFFALQYVMNRFQHVGHVALILDSSSEMLSSYLGGKFIPFWADGLPQMVVYKLMGVEYYKLNSFMVGELMGYPDAYWNTNPGLAGWAGLLQERAMFLLIYVIGLLSSTYYFMYRYAGKRYLLLLASFSLVYLYHGWIGAYFNLCLYAVVLVIILRSRFRLQKHSALGGDS